MAEQYEQVERFEGIHAPTGEEVKPKRVWGKNDHWPGHRFSDAEVQALLDGDQVSFEAISKAGKPYTVKGRLEQGIYKERTYWGFKADFNSIPDVFLGHRFSAQEKADLEAGKTVRVEGLVSKKGNEFAANISYGEKEGGEKGLILAFD